MLRLLVCSAWLYCVVYPVSLFDLRDTNIVSVWFEVLDWLFCIEVGWWFDLLFDWLVVEQHGVNRLNMGIVLYYVFCGRLTAWCALCLMLVVFSLCVY